jgi:hypothetical protein
MQEFALAIEAIAWYHCVPFYIRVLPKSEAFHGFVTSKKIPAGVC